MPEETGQLQSPGNRHSERSEESPWQKRKFLRANEILRCDQNDGFSHLSPKCNFAILLPEEMNRLGWALGLSPKT